MQGARGAGPSRSDGEGVAVLMGRAPAVDLAGALSLDVGLEHHLLYNHFPPVDLSWLPVAKHVVEKCRETPPPWDFLNETVVLDDGSRIETADGSRRKTYGSVLEDLHLEAFLLGYWEEED